MYFRVVQYKDLLIRPVIPDVGIPLICKFDGIYCPQGKFKVDKFFGGCSRGGKDENYAVLVICIIIIFSLTPSLAGDFFRGDFM